LEQKTFFLLASASASWEKREKRLGDYSVAMGNSHQKLLLDSLMGLKGLREYMITFLDAFHFTLAQGKIRQVVWAHIFLQVANTESR
jgi:hypothetical protein